MVIDRAHLPLRLLLLIERDISRAELERQSGVAARPDTIEQRGPELRGLAHTLELNIADLLGYTEALKRMSSEIEELRTAADRERTDLRAKISELEAKLREANQARVLAEAEAERLRGSLAGGEGLASSSRV